MKKSLSDTSERLLVYIYYGAAKEQKNTTGPIPGNKTVSALEGNLINVMSRETVLKDI